MDRYLNAFQGAQGFPGEITAKLVQGDEWRREALAHSELQRAIRQSGHPGNEKSRRFGIATLGAALVRLGTRMQGKAITRMNPAIS